MLEKAAEGDSSFEGEGALQGSRQEAGNNRRARGGGGRLHLGDEDRCAGRRAEGAGGLPDGGLAGAVLAHQQDHGLVLKVGVLQRRRVGTRGSDTPPPAAAPCAGRAAAEPPSRSAPGPRPYLRARPACRPNQLNILPPARSSVPRARPLSAGPGL